ncbi:uncharacterized protein LOC132864013 isoform X1 [Tachysurus vachellii]|uniref:uncharacterized protein LOC132864013 isoform X1 n=1 Tax=Tachysurus vachellii TaxID=175792 RepID=UPI00296B271C|nr:uncharacterized protein LOC132864013 isoform X1 [Tachysurus vachellii]
MFLLKDQSCDMGAIHPQRNMLKQDRPVNAAFAGHLGGTNSTLRILGNSQRMFEKDGNFNFLGQDENTMTGDENRNQMRPRALGLTSRYPPTSANHYVPGPLSPLSRLPCWSPLEPLPEIDSGEDTGGRVPPDGAEEGKIDEEMRRMSDDEKEEEQEDLMKGKAQERVEDIEEDGVLDWEESDEDFEFSYRSESSSPITIESGDVTGGDSLNFTWDRICVGGSNSENSDATTNLEGKQNAEEDKKAEMHRKRLGGSSLAEEASSDSESDPCSELPELMEAVWTLEDRERFKAEEMEKHHVQLTMYRRLALIRWVRTLQERVQEQQNRLQSSFDIILTHRKELLRMGSAAAAVSQ